MRAPARWVHRFTQLVLLTIYKEFSHVDFVERATELISLTLRTLRGEIRPTLARHDCRMIERYPTSQEPMRSFVDRMMSLEFHSELSSMSNLPPDHPGGGDPSILSISAVHGFMPADVADVGSQMVVITDDDPDKAQSLATQLGAELFALRGRTRPQYLTAAEGVAAVEAAVAGGVDKPVVIADTGDNPGGGLPGDSTNLLRPLLASAKANRLGSMAVGSVCDPQAVQLCTAAGEGAQLQLRFGGKLHMAGGEPIDALVEVLAVETHATQSFADATISLGPACAVRLLSEPGSEAAFPHPVDVVLNTHRVQAFEPDLFSNLGLDVAEYSVLMVKSSNHFFAGFSPIASQVLYVQQGPFFSNPHEVGYTKLRHGGRLWPFVADPHDDGSAPVPWLPEEVSVSAESKL